MEKNIILATVLLVFLIIAGFSHAETSGHEMEVVHLKDNSFSCTFDNVKHNFVLDLPEKTEGSPLVLMLPGYGNSAESLRTAVRFEKEANAMGYAVAYVTGAKDPKNAVSSFGWNSGIAADGNDDTAFLIALAAYLQKEYSLDPDRTYAAGFSNGAFMMHRLAMEAADTFSACVSVAGLMPLKIWDSRKDVNEISFFQIYGEKDAAIPKNSDGSANNAKDPAIEDVMAYWAQSCGLELCDSEEIGKGSVLTKCRDDQRPDQVWTLFVKGGMHSWPTEKLNGIDTNSLILEFFETVSLRRGEKENGK